MSRSYNKLWHMLIDRNMSRSELRRQAGITTNALAKLGRNESVPLITLEKICAVLDCGLDDIVEHWTDDSDPSVRKAL
ncbi:MAG: helix-turn-helix transcriptional regulator [Eubacteriaceae bacterium]|nr:helix-turn-helix transcriptional regulator [Eubacteriaceae bacterium]